MVSCLLGSPGAACAKVCARALVPFPVPPESDSSRSRKRMRAVWECLRQIGRETVQTNRRIDLQSVQPSFPPIQVTLVRACRLLVTVGRPVLFLDFLQSFIYEASNQFRHLDPGTLRQFLERGNLGIREEHGNTLHGTYIRWAYILVKYKTHSHSK